MAGMPQATGINIVADDTVAMDVTLVGVQYRVTPPKAALAMKAAITLKGKQDDPEAMMAVLNEWLTAAVGTKTFHLIEKRLADPKDKLDIMHISALMEKVIEAQTENPTS